MSVEELSYSNSNSIVTAYIPVEESLGICDKIYEATSGEVFP